MGKNSIKSLSLATFAALFAAYSFTSYNFRVGSISTAGLVIKYSTGNRAPAAIDCAPVSSPITKDSIDNCAHHIEENVLENGDVEYKITTIYKGHISKGERLISAEDAAEDGHNDDFIKGLLQKSFDKFEAAGDDTFTLTSPDAPETPEAPEEDAAPAITPPEDDRPASADNETSSGDDTDLDAEILLETIKDYEFFKNRYRSCKTSLEYEEKFKSFIEDYNQDITDYVQKVEAFETSDDDESPFEKLSLREKEKMEEFVAEIEGFDYFLRSNDLSESETLACLVERSDSIETDEAQYTHYAKYIQPILRSDLQETDYQSLNALATSIGENQSIQKILAENTLIQTSLAHDFLNREAQVVQLEMDKQQNVLEPQKSNNLRILQEELDQTKSNIGLLATNVAASNDDSLNSIISSGNEFWGQEGSSQEIIAGQGLTDNILNTDVAAQSTAALQTDAAAAEAGAPITINNDTDALRRLQQMYDRIQNAKGNARKQAVVERGAHNVNTNEYRGDSVPQVGDKVESSAIN